MKIYLLERDSRKAELIWEAFAGEPVEVVCEDFEQFMKTHHVEAVVSPANSYGLMDGGYDLAITRWFGDQLQKRVQKYILDHCWGEQPVGTSFLIDAGRDGQKLIHTPTMRTPKRILEPAVIYQAMRTTLMTALQNGVESIVIPLFGGLTGGVDASVAAKLMLLGYRQIMHSNSEINWNVVSEIDRQWRELGVN